MTKTTDAPNLLPYPEGHDFVAQGDDAIRALADRTDLRLGRWATYVSTPTNLTVPAASPMQASYMRTSEWVHARIRVVIQAISGVPRFSVPVDIHADFASGLIPIGHASGVRQGVRYYFGAVVAYDTQTVQIVDQVSADYWQATKPTGVTWATNDVWLLNVGYRPAVAN